MKHLFLALSLLILPLTASAQPVNLTDAYHPAKDRLVTVWRSQDGTIYERTTYRIETDRRFRLERVYGTSLADVLTRPDCPRVEDLYTFDGVRLWYTSTRDYYAGTAVVYEPGHLWLSTDEKLAQSRAQKTAGEAMSLAGGGCTPVPGIVQERVSNTVWRAVQDGGTRSVALTGATPTLRLDEVTVVGGSWDNLWREEWFFANLGVLGMVPVETVGYRIVGGSSTVLWKNQLVGVFRLP